MTASPDTRPRDETRVFLSYSRRDAEFVDRLEQALSAHGVTVYIDRTAIEHGVDWWERICQLISMSDTVVFVLSPDAVQSEVCTRELEHAIQLGKRLMPVVCRPLDNAVVPESLAKLNYVHFTAASPDAPAIDFDIALERLLTALNTDITWVREHTRLGELARYWDARERPNDLLLRGKELRTAVDWLHSTLQRERSDAPDKDDVVHTFIRDSASASYKLGFYGWRYRLLAIPAIIVVPALILSALWFIDTFAKTGIFTKIGMNDLTNFVGLLAAVSGTVFLVYLVGSFRRRYQIARCIEFRSVRASQWFALRTVLYNALWLGAIAIVVAILLN